MGIVWTQWEKGTQVANQPRPENLLFKVLIGPLVLLCAQGSSGDGRVVIKKKLKLETDAANGGLLPTITDRPRTEGLGRTTANEADPTAENSTGGLVRCYYTSSRSSATPDDRGWIPSSVTMLPIIHTRSHGSVSREHGMDPVVNPSIDNFSVDSSISLAPVPRRGLVAVRQTEFYRRLPK